MLKTKLVNLLILVVGLFLIVNFSRSIGELLKAGERVKDEEKKLQELEKKNEDLNKKLEEVQSSNYLEKMARDKLGLVKEGEVVVILPPLPSSEPATSKENLSNWQKWWKLFF